MGTYSAKNFAFFVSVTAAITVTVAIILCTLTLGGAKLEYEAEFYFVCYAVKDNSIAADTISGTVSSYGGAGYVLECGDKYYVTVACYYTENEAKIVQNNLSRRGLQCMVLKIETDEYPIRYLSRGNEELFKGNLNTLYSLSRLCYECANELDTGGYSQNNAKRVLADVESALNGLKQANVDNCFANELRRLITECKAAGEGFIYSKDMRKLQITIIDTIINIDMY